MSRSTRLPLGATPRLYERISDALEQRIATGRIAPGTRLLEMHLAERFGVSRAPARRALARLEEAGLIEKVGGRGYLVRPRDTPLLPVTPEPPMAAGASDKLISTATWERIYGEVERETVARAAFGTWRITETDLGEHYRVSRTVAREVLARLQHVGIVKKDGRSRWYVPALTRERVRELYEMRWILEPVALKQAAPRIEPTLLSDMRGELEDALRRFPRIESSELDHLERSLHIALLSRCDSATLIETLQHFHALLIVHSYLYSMSPDTFASDPFLSEHLEIVRCLEARRMDEAAGALEHHLRVSLDRALRRIDFIVRHCEPEPLPYLALLGAS